MGTRDREEGSALDFEALEVELSVTLARRSFGRERNGYARSEVDAFCSQVATIAQQMLTRAASLTAEARGRRRAGCLQPTGR
ncbi:MAG: hypothetical protein C4289_11990 [Chloroflexota bacterium]